LPPARSGPILGSMDSMGALDATQEAVQKHMVLAAVERVVSGTLHLENDAVARLDALQAGLAEKAFDLDEGPAAAWLAAQAHALDRGCPAAQIVTYAGIRHAFRANSDGVLRRLSLLGKELAANTMLSSRADFVEGASSAYGLRSGDRPLWDHDTRQQASRDPEVRMMVACVLGASPLETSTELGGHDHGPCLSSPSHVDRAFNARSMSDGSSYHAATPAEH